MRKINKSTPLAHFNGRNYNNSCRTWQDFHKDHKDIYEETRLQILTEEQNGLCGYTEIYINELEKCHIDHYKKRAFFPDMTFDWNNLIVATKDDDFGANFKDSVYKIKKEEYSDIYNPVTDDITFEYDEWGEIVEQEGKIKKTVEVFNLNCKSLKRRSIMSPEKQTT